MEKETVPMEKKERIVMNKTEPRTLPGFMELLPQDQILFNQINKYFIIHFVLIAMQRCIIHISE